MSDLPIRAITVCTKNHLDVGFTESEAKVLHDACRWLLPTAAAQGKRMREAGDGCGFVWTVPSFIAEHALEILDGDVLRSVEAGFAAGDIAWQALPFTTHTELLDEGLLDAAVAVARRLDVRFGKRTICAKLTDVPGHTLGLVRALARAGVEFLHVGVNYMSAMPKLPPLFRWRDEDGNEVVTAYSSFYGGEVRLPGEDHVLQWDVLGDNMEIPSEADQRARFAAIRAQHPGACVRAGRAEDWAGTDLRVRAASLPVITAEIGDSWVFGTGSDPWKTARFRELIRLRREWLESHRLVPGSRTLVALDRQLLLVAEHTWGLAVGASSHHDRTHWDNSDFAGIRRRGCWLGLEASWQEQRDHIDLAVAALDDPRLRSEAQAACDACAPTATDRTGWLAVDPATDMEIAGARIRLDARGAMVSLVSDGVERVAGNGALGLFRYRTYDDADCRRWCKEYATIKEDWLLGEFAKAGLERSRAISQLWEPRITACWRHGDQLEVDLAFPESAVREAGAPGRATVAYHIAPDGLTCRLTWWDKHPTRLPESLWWTFQLKVADPAAWRIDKSGRWIDPLDVASSGGRWLHGVQKGARNGSVRLHSRDAHLLALGDPLLYAFPDRQPDPSGGLHLNLANNLWGTNFPQWCGDDLAFRVSIHWR